MTYLIPILLWLAMFAAPNTTPSVHPVRPIGPITRVDH